MRKYIVFYKYKYQGECVLNRKLSLNEEDFYTCDNIKHIPFDYFFSYKDKDGFHYSYDIRSFQKLMNYDVKNPYNRFNIPEDVIQQYQHRISYLKQKNIHILEENEYQEMNPKQIFRDKVLSTFQTLNALAHYCNMDWFFHLSNRQLKHWYKEAEDIFNYRANLNIEQKRKIIPDDKAFYKTVYYVYHIHNKKELREIVIHEINRFITLGVSREDKYTGSLYVLTALAIVSPEVSNSMSWLIQ